MTIWQVMLSYTIVRQKYCGDGETTPGARFCLALGMSTRRQRHCSSAPASSVPPMPPSCSPPTPCCQPRCHKRCHPRSSSCLTTVWQLSSFPLPLLDDIWDPQFFYTIWYSTVPINNIDHKQDLFSLLFKEGLTMWSLLVLFVLLVSTDQVFHLLLLVSGVLLLSLFPKILARATFIL